MRKISLLSLALTAFMLTAHSQNKPKATYQVDAAIVTVWENEKEGKYGPYIELNFKVEKVYKKDDEWNSTNYFNLEELLQLRAALDKAISRHAVEVKEGEE